MDEREPKWEKAERYFRLLHPEYDTLTEEEQIGLTREQSMITYNIDADTI